VQGDTNPNGRNTSGSVGAVPLSGGERLRTREELAWAAGLFDGEGSIVLVKRANHRQHAEMSMGLTDRDLIQRFQNVMGGCMNGPHTHVAGLAMWSWNLHTFEKVQAAIVMLWPWLGERRRTRATEVLSQVSQPLTSEEDFARRSVAQKIRWADTSPERRSEIGRAVSRGRRAPRREIQSHD